MLRAWWAARTSVLFPALDHTDPFGPDRTATAPAADVPSLKYSTLLDRYAAWTKSVRRRVYRVGDGFLASSMTLVRDRD